MTLKCSDILINKFTISVEDGVSLNQLGDFYEGHKGWIFHVLSGGLIQPHTALHRLSMACKKIPKILKKNTTTLADRLFVFLILRSMIFLCARRSSLSSASSMASSSASVIWAPVLGSPKVESDSLRTCPDSLYSAGLAE